MLLTLYVYGHISLLSFSFNYLLYRFLLCSSMFFFFFKQKTAYEMRISDWSSDVCSSDLTDRADGAGSEQDGDDIFLHRASPSGERAAGKAASRSAAQSWPAWVRKCAANSLAPCSDRIASIRFCVSGSDAPHRASATGNRTRVV